MKSAESLAPSAVSLDWSDGDDVIEFVLDAAVTLVATVDVCDIRTLLRNLSSCCCSTDSAVEESIECASDAARGRALMDSVSVLCASVSVSGAASGVCGNFSRLAMTSSEVSGAGFSITIPGVPGRDVNCVSSRGEGCGDDGNAPSFGDVKGDGPPGSLFT